MRQFCFLFLSLFLSTAAFTIQQPQVNRHGSSIAMIAADSPAPAVSMDQTQGTNYLTQQKVSSVNQFLNNNVMESTSNMVSLKERPPPPTAEEIAAKKASFNFWFWGGGFVAPFLATFYYFGLKFWEK
jgi:hypothetical protein